MVQWSNANEKARWQRKIQFYRVRREKSYAYSLYFHARPITAINFHEIASYLGIVSSKIRMEGRFFKYFNSQLLYALKITYCILL